MTDEKKLQDIFQKIAQTETTSELRDYWLDQYKSVTNQEILILDQGTIDFFSVEEITKPVTPIASINLDKLVNNGVVDEVLMQQNVEVAVRLLDSSLDALNFSDEVQDLIGQFRKIGVKLINYEKYLGDELSKTYKDKFENLGSAFSNACYRSSESLAEEKGVCLDWDNLKFQLRPKAFEYWYNMETGEIHNGLEVYEDYTPQTVRNSPFEVVPRRNSHIIILPNNPEWSIWSDREINNNEVKLNNITKSQDNLSSIQIDEVPLSDPSLRGVNNVQPETIPFDQVLPNIIDSSNQQAQSKLLSKTLFNLESDLLEPKATFESSPILNDDNNLQNEESDVFLKSMNLNTIPIPEEIKSPIDLLDLESEAMLPSHSLIVVDPLDSVEPKKEVHQIHNNSKNNQSVVSENTDSESMHYSSITHKIVEKSTEEEPKFAQTKKVTNTQTIKNINNFVMSQYTISLQQVVNLDSLGNFLISANYDADGLKMINYQGGTLSPENDKLIRGYLGLINMSLSKGLTPSEISEEIMEDSGEESSVVTQMINMLGSILKTLPANINQVSSNNLKSLDLATVRRATKLMKNVLEV